MAHLYLTRFGVSIKQREIEPSLRLTGQGSIFYVQIHVQICARNHCAFTDRAPLKNMHERVYSITHMRTHAHTQTPTHTSAQTFC